MSELLKKKCIPCEKNGTKPMALGEASDMMMDIPGWNIVLENDPEGPDANIGARISREYKFKDFIGAVNFVERVADIAEEEMHHPDVHIFYNKVVLELYTHAINGLSENDFIVAAKVDAQCLLGFK